MSCETIAGPNGTTIIACNRAMRGKRCRECGGKASVLCDFPLKGRKAGKTCDRPLCESCAVRQPGKQTDGETIDYCPGHDRMVGCG